MAVLNEYGKKHNISFISVDTLSSEAGNANGLTIGGTNKIIIALDAEAGAILSVAGHEVFHHIKNQNAADAQILEDFVINHLKQSDKFDYDKRFNELAKRYGTYDETEINEEIAANAMFDVIANENTVNELINENPPLIKKIGNAIKKFIDYIKEAINALAQAGWDEAGALKDDLETLEKIQDMFDNAMRKIDGNNKNTVNAKYSIKVTKNMPYEEQLRKINENKLNGSNSLYVSDSIDSLTDLGIFDAPFAMNQSDYRKSKRTQANNKHYSKHGIPDSFFAKLPNLLRNAPMLINNGEKITIITDYRMNDTRGNDSFVIVGIMQNQKMENDTVNLIKSIYPFDDFIDRIKSAAESEKLVIKNKKKAENILTTIGVQPSEVSSILNLAKANIPQNNPDVNTQYMQNDEKNSLKASLKDNDKKSKRLSEKDIDEYLLAGGRNNISKQTALNKGLNIILTTPDMIKNYIHRAISGEHLPTSAYGKANDRIVNDVRRYSKGKIDISDCYLEFVANDIKHAYGQHISAKQTGDIDLHMQDFENIPEYLDDYDELIYAIQYSSGKKGICVSKKTDNGRILIIETVSLSRGALQLKNVIGVSEEKWFFVNSWGN